MRRYLYYIIQALIILSGYLFINIPDLDLQIGVFRTGDGGFWLPSLWGVLINAILFYGNVYLLIPNYLRSDRKPFYFVLLIVLLIGLSAVETIADYYYAQFIGLQVSTQGVNEIIGLVVAVNVLSLLTSYAYRFSIDWFANERMKERLENEKLTTELSFLKSQVNPHFLFNTLNNLFSMAMQNDDEETADGIGKLSALMRYMIYESNTDFIALSKELDYINNYIALQKLRFNSHENVNINVEVEGEVSHQKIAPMLLIPFIENAFKYGISVNEPSSIDIRLKLQQERIEFTVENGINYSARNKVDRDSSGIGLTNAKQRLELLYIDKYELDIVEEQDQFKVKLKLQSV